MELVNTTPAPAKLFVSELVPGEPRIGSLVAKASFRIEGGATNIERDDPVPIFDGDEETDLGLLPRDDLPSFEQESFQVILLGVAHAPGDAAVPAVTVALSVGPVQRTLSVWGDRRWVGTGADAGISEATPFVRMPLTWSRAYGGTTEVLIDVDSPVAVGNPLNPSGRGHDPTPSALALAETMVAPEGYPRWVQERPLPNLEDPRSPIARWDDAPDPCCWATVPLESGVHALRLMNEARLRGESPDPKIEPTATHRAHPDWVISLPERAAPVQMHGMAPEGPVSFPLPAIRLLADYVLGDRTGVRELRPRTLVLMPEERRGYLVFREQFTYSFEAEQERSFRLRMADGWFGAESLDGGSR